MTDEELRAKHHHTKGDGSWWLTDARGIPCTRVCDECEEAKMARYNPKIFSEDYDQFMSDAGEQVEEDY